jgi:tetratricopeptide (TPR) repeat protein
MNAEATPLAEAVTSGSTTLRALRLSRHWTQVEFAAEFEKASRGLGKVLSLSVRQVRRWESEGPPCPLPAYQRVLEEIFGVSVTQMGFQVGFEVPWAPVPVLDRLPRVDAPASRLAVEPVVAASETSAEAGLRLSSAADPAGRAVPFDRGMVDGYQFITAQQLTLYWMVPPARMYQQAVAHAQLGAALLSGTGPENQRARLADSLAQVSLLAARLAHWDLQNVDQARRQYRNALIAAREAGDHEIASAILGHLALIPAYGEQPAEARDLMRAAYAHAARGVSKGQQSWLHAVDAEVESRLGDPKRAIDLITRAEDAFWAGASDRDDPQWQDYYDSTRLNGFKGFCHLNAGNADKAREALQNSLMALKPSDAKQRTVVLADLAGIYVQSKEVDQACAILGLALENLDAHWYAFGRARIETVWESLQARHGSRPVRELDNRIRSSWPASIRLVTD